MLPEKRAMAEGANIVVVVVPVPASVREQVISDSREALNHEEESVKVYILYIYYLFIYLFILFSILCSGSLSSGTIVSGNRYETNT